MNKEDLKNILDIFTNIGDQICSWRENYSYRKIVEPSAFKTEADLKAHNIISDALHKLDSGIDIISEESATHSLIRPKTYWLIDPIDGTASWYEGYEGFVTQAALIVNDIPEFGVIYAPALKTLWYGIRNKGAFKNGERLNLINESEKIKIIDNTSKPHGVAKYIYESLKANEYIECGSLGLKSVKVADGSADIFIKDVPVRDWDVAPADVILSELGGSITYFDGEKYSYKGSYTKINGIIVARHKSIVNKVLRLLEENNFIKGKLN